MMPSRLYVAMRGAALLVSFVVMAWVPILFALMDTMPHIASALIRRHALVLVAMRMATGWRAVRLGVLLYLLAPVMVVLLLAEVAPVLLANMHLQLVLWWRNHLRQARSQ